MKIFGLEVKRAKNFIGNTGDTQIADLRTGSILGDYAWGGGMLGGDKSATIRSDYENGFAPISAIIDEVIKRNIRMVDRNNSDRDVSLSQPIWYAINHPNRDMSYSSFLSVLFSGFLSMPEISLLLWHHNGERAIPGCPDGGFTDRNIAGFTVIPRWAKCCCADGSEEWRIQTKHGQTTFCKKSVITLKYSVLPDNGRTGVSPGSAASQEAAIRDQLNQYERGFFTNGAKPSLIVTISARNREEFVAIRDSYERANRGAGKQGGVVYQSVINNPIEGMGQPSISVEPVGSVNDSLAINDIVSFTSQTINANYGVSPIIFGDSSTTTYQNQQIVDRKFMGRVESVMFRLFREFEHELSRITKTELPYIFAWDSTDIELTDELKVKAETNLANVDSLQRLVTFGATVDQAVAALGLPESWLSLTQENPTVSEVIDVVNVKNEIPEHYEVKIREPKKLENIRDLLQAITEDMVKQENAISDEDRIAALIDILNVLHMNGATSTIADLQRKVDSEGIDIALQEYVVSPDNVKAIDDRARSVLNNFESYINGEISKYMESTPEWWASAVMGSLAIANRIDMITIGESKNAYQGGQLGAAKQADNQISQGRKAHLVKYWDASGPNPCEFCLAINGTEAGIQDTFVPGGVITAASGDTIVLDTDYTDGTLPDAHAHCVCTWRFEIKVQ